MIKQLQFNAHCLLTLDIMARIEHDKKGLR